MKLTIVQSSQSSEVVSLFRKTFGDSEGDAEGETIGKLVEALVDTTKDGDLHGYCAEDEDDLLGCIFFSRLLLDTEIPTFMLAPVAVSTQYQRKGIGQTLINFGLKNIRHEGAELVLTYGDPSYYSKLGFEPVAEHTISAPYPLTHPEGWQAQSLIGTPIPSVKGKTQCVEAFRSPAYW